MHYFSASGLFGEVSEWLMVSAWKAEVGEIPPQVQILSSPPEEILNRFN